MNNSGAGHNWRKPALNLCKIALTVVAFYLLFNHQVADGSGGTMSTWQAVREKLPELDVATMVPFLLLAALIKAVGIFSSMGRWYLLLKAQAIKYPFWYLAGTFLIGRFIGTFLPSTLGLDGYKLYDAAKGSGKVVESAAATIIEKILGLTGIFITFLVAFPGGAAVFGDHLTLVAAITLPLALLAVAATMALLLFPQPVAALLQRIWLPKKIANLRQRITDSALSYKGRPGTTLALLGLSFNVHFCTAAMYFFTALAIGATAPFWVVTLGSTVQIVATVLSPFTIAGEGVREIVQALMLSKEMGISESVLSAALGFWAAEALTLVGGIIWLLRRKQSSEVIHTGVENGD